MHDLISKFCRIRWPWSKKRKVRCRRVRRPALQHLAVEPLESRTLLSVSPTSVDSTTYSDPSEFVQVGEIFYFTAESADHGRELWATDGTEDGAYLVKDIDNGTDSSDPTELIEFNGKLYFAADDGENGVELWVSDGTRTGTVMVADINSGDGTSDSSPHDLTVSGGALYFCAEDAVHGAGLWKSDGTAGGTVLLDDTITDCLTDVNEYLVTAGYVGDGAELYSFALSTAATGSARLSIWVDGEEVTIDQEIGVYSDDTMAEVYTSADGEEGQLFFGSDTAPTLDEFFETWRTDAGNAGDNDDATFSSHELMGNATDSSYSIQMFVNGEVRNDFEDYAIQDGDEIILVYSDNPVVSIVTNYGPIVIELYEEETPITVENFLTYVNDGDYIDSIFHRSVPDFVIQGGGFTTDSETFTDTSQFTAIENNGQIQNESLLPNDYGTVAMARTSSYDSATSQFYVNLRDNDSLNPTSSTAHNGYTVFGRVLDMTTVEIIESLPVDKTHASPFGELPYSSSDQLVVVESVEGLGDITGYKFYDTDGDGVFDSDEEGIEGVKVFIDADGDGELDDGETWTTTDADGRYLLQAEPGTYTVCAEVTPGYTDTTGDVEATVEIGVETEDVNLGEVDPSAPTAVDDAYTMDEDDVLEVDEEDGVLVNDTDPDDDDLTATLADEPDHGTVVFDTDGSFKYTPEDDFAGTDTFTYTVSDGTNASAAATVTITVENVSDAPVAEDDAFDAVSDGTAQLLNVLGNDTDADDADSLAIVSVTQGSGGGTVVFHNDGVVYTPVDGFSGTETFSYTIQDEDGNQSTATVTVTVAEGSGSVETGSSSLSGHVYIDADGDGGFGSSEMGLPGVLITLSGTTEAGNAVYRQRLTDDDGHYSFDDLPAGTYSLTESQPEIMTDGEDSTSVAGAVVGDDVLSGIVVGDDDSFEDNNFGEGEVRSGYITVRMFFVSTSLQDYFRTLAAYGEELAGNDDLAVAIRDGETVYGEDSDPGSDVDDNTAPVGGDDEYTVDEDSTLTVDADKGLLDNDDDDDGDTLTAALLSGPGNGALSLESDGSFEYTPDADFAGTDTFTYVVYDGTTISDAVTVTVTVTPQNDEPSATTDEVALAAVEATDIDVLANDTDPDAGDTLTIESYDATSTEGATITLNSDGTLHYDPTTSTTLVEETATTDSFTYTITDGHTGVFVTGTVNIDLSDTGTTSITLDGDSISVSGRDATVDGTTVTLTSARTYTISGTLNDGRIIVDTDDGEDVTIVLNGVDITCSDNAPIYVVNATGTVIVLADGTENYVTDGDTYASGAGDDGPDAAIYSNGGLVIEGDGSLTVDANYSDGIFSSDGLDIDSGNIAVTAEGHGIRGGDSVTVLDGVVTVTAGGDGIWSESTLTISGGTIGITTGGGNTATLGFDESAKALKAEVGVGVTGGTITIDSADDAVHSDDTVAISGGDITITSGDGGIYAENGVTIDGGDIDVTKSNMGIESVVVTVNDGTIHLVSSDDGINIAGGNDDDATANPDAYFKITGGYIFMDAQGDGCDSNGSVYVSGGTLIINGPTESTHGALNHNGTFEITGGLLLAVGDAGMAGSPSASSTQETLEYSYGSTQPAGVMIHIETEGGEEVLTFVPVNAYQSVVISSADLELGTTYVVYSGGSSSGTETDGLYSGGTYTPGTEFGTVTLS